MTGTNKTYKGDDATILITAGGTDITHSTLAISDFSITLDRGVNEQELVGETGNYFVAGSLSVDGSLTSCKLHSDAVGKLVSDMIDGKTITVSGNCGTDSVAFYFVSAQITGFDFSIGDADTITEGTIDFSLLKPYLVSGLGYKSNTKVFLTDRPLSDVNAIAY